MPLYNRAVILASGGRKEFWKARRNAWEGGAAHRLDAARNILMATKAVNRFPGITSFRRTWNLSDIKAVEHKLKVLEEKKYIRCSEGKIYFLRRGEGKEINIVRTIANIVDERLGGDNFSQINKAYPRLFKKINDFSEVPERYVGFFKRRYYALRHPFLLSEAYDIGAAEIIGNRYRNFATFMNMLNFARHPECISRYQEIVKAMEEAKERPLSWILEQLNKIEEPESDGSEEVIPDIRPDNNLPYKFCFVAGDIHVMPHRHTEEAELARFSWMGGKRLKANFIGAGDILDIWAFGGKLERIFDANPLFFKGIAQFKKFFYILGNHDQFMGRIFKKYDWVLKRLGVVPIPEELYDSKRRIFIKHGHQMDAANRPGAKTGKRVTRVGYFIADLLGPRLGPRFLRWGEFLALLVTARQKWQEDRVDDTVDMIREDFIRLSEERERKGEEPFSKEEPLIYKVGHQHSMGLTYTFDKIIKKIQFDETLSELVRDDNGNVVDGHSKVIFFFTGTWYDKKLYSGDFLALDLTDPNSTVVFPFCWERTVPESFISYYVKKPGQEEQRRRTLSGLAAALAARFNLGNQQ